MLVQITASCDPFTMRHIYTICQVGSTITGVLPDSPLPDSPLPESLLPDSLSPDSHSSWMLPAPSSTHCLSARHCSYATLPAPLQSECSAPDVCVLCLATAATPTQLIILFAAEGPLFPTDAQVSSASTIVRDPLVMDGTPGWDCIKQCIMYRYSD